MNQYFHKEALKIKLDERSKFLRKLVIKCIEAGGRGHIGAAMSLIEILRVLYDNFLVFDPKNVNLKGNLNLVTLTDKESELNIKSIISGVFLDQTILVEEELKRKEVTIKDMDTGDQKTIEIDSILTFFHN